MRFFETMFEGVWIVELEPVRDERGRFARTFCMREYAERKLEICFVQHSTSHSTLRGTLRGMHFQRGVHEEVKIVQCLRGAVWDVVVDLRQSSPTFLRSFGIELSSSNSKQLYIPRGFAHGFLTLTDDAEVHYLISNFYDAESSSGFSYKDPAFGIQWPFSPEVVSERDRSWPPFKVSG
jgi:dTDP-4-dehydrorhamnose 3,5-epimerase